MILILKKSLKLDVEEIQEVGVEAAAFLALLKKRYSYNLRKGFRMQDGFFEMDENTVHDILRFDKPKQKKIILILIDFGYIQTKYYEGIEIRHFKLLDDEL